MRSFGCCRWQLDEMSAKLNGEMADLWRAVDRESEVLESYVTRTRDKDAALRFTRKTLKWHGSPEAISIDGLRSYGAAMKDSGNAQKQDVGRWANNRMEIRPPAFPTTQTRDAQVHVDEDVTEVCQRPQLLQPRTLTDRSNHLQSTSPSRTRRVVVDHGIVLPLKDRDALCGDLFTLD